MHISYKSSKKKICWYIVLLMIIQIYCQHTRKIRKKKLAPTEAMNVILDLLSFVAVDTVFRNLSTATVKAIIQMSENKGRRHRKLPTIFGSLDMLTWSKGWFDACWYMGFVRFTFHFIWYIAKGILPSPPWLLVEHFSIPRPLHNSAEMLHARILSSSSRICLMIIISN